MRQTNDVENGPAGQRGVVMSNTRYTAKQQDDFCVLAQEVGIGKAIRELRYPTYPTAIAWMKARNITPNIDTLMQTVKQYHLFWENADARLVAESGMQRVHELLANDVEIGPEEMKKLSDAYSKYVNAWLVLQGKSNDIRESRETTQSDLAIMDLLNAQRAKNAETESEIKSS
jgi:plasmid maintenance system antidote protein VapI